MKHLGICALVIFGIMLVSADPVNAQSGEAAHLFSGEEAYEGQSCKVAILADELVLEIPASFGPPCVQNFIRSVEVCSQGEPLIEFALHETASHNILGAPETSMPNVNCATATIRAKTADHRGNYPAYACSPATYRAVLEVRYCAD